MTGNLSDEILKSELEKLKLFSLEQMLIIKESKEDQ
jgi:hypothetical protein